VKIVEKIIPDKDTDEEFRLKYINVGTVSTSEISILQAKKEIGVYTERIINMFGYVKELFITEKDKEFEKRYEKIEKYEDISDRMEIEIANYLTKVSESELSAISSRRIRAMFEMIDDIESIGDSCYNLAKAMYRKKEGKIEFTEEISLNIKNMFDLVDEALTEMQKNLSDEYSNIDESKAIEIEEKINNYRNQLRKEHMQNIKAGKYKYKTGVIYNELFSTAEKLADYIINVTEAIQEAKV